MAGDATNAAIWANADVFIAPEGTTGPTDVTTPWDVATWEAVGLLDGDSGFTMSRDDDVNEVYAWGGKLIKRTRSKHKRSIAFVAMEDNDVVFGIVNPGSTRTTDVGTGITTSVVKVPAPASFAIGFELRDGDKIKRRWVSHAEVDKIADLKESEKDPSVFEITTILFPESDGTLYHEVEGPAA